MSDLPKKHPKRNNFFTSIIVGGALGSLIALVFRRKKTIKKSLWSRVFSFKKEEKPLPQKKSWWQFWRRGV